MNFSTCSNNSNADSSIDDLDGIDDIADMEIPGFYKNIVYNSPDAIVCINLKGVIVFNNPATERIFGYLPGELKKTKVNCLMYEPHNRMHDMYLKSYLEHRDISELHESNTVPAHSPDICKRRLIGKRKDGSEVYIALTVYELTANIFAGIIQDLTSEKTNNERITKEIDEKNMFAANISHELRTPLNAILNVSEFVDEDMDEIKKNIPESQYHEFKENMAIIRRSSTILLTQINDILDYSKLDAKKVALVDKDFSLRACLEECKTLQAQTAADKRLDIITYIHPDVPDALIGDSDRLSQIINNLLYNAIKFTEVGKIVIEVNNFNKEDDKCHLVFKIKDTGVGISPTDQDKLFTSFSQIDNSHTKKYNGTGLGLSICKKICKLFDGDVWLDSSAFGRGSTFAFSVNLGIQDEREKEPEFDLSALKGKQVLVVDDDRHNIDTYKWYILEWGMVPITSDSASGALVYINNGFKFDLALLDIRMPRVGGVELARRIRLSDHDYPIIALSSAQTPVDGSNFDALLTKPVKKSKLLRIIYQSLTNRASPPASPNSTADVYDRRRPSMSRDYKSKMILIAEDNMDNQIVVCARLRRAGYTHYKVVDNGDDAIKEIMTGKYALALIDIKMPGTDGIEVSRYINENMNELIRPITIALTAVATYGEREYYINTAGFTDYLPKPIRGVDFDTMLKKYLDDDDFII